MKKIIFYLTLFISCVSLAQKTHNIQSNSANTSQFVHEIDSIRFNLITGTMEVVLKNGTVSPFAISTVDSVTFSGPTSLYAFGSVFCGEPTEVVEVVSATGRIWMDRNLGASKVADSLTDVAAYGSYYQWGRASDGHQCPIPTTTPILSTGDTPGHANFITTPLGASPYDWRSTKNDALWQGVNGINNPCPCGFRLPTTQEFQAEVATWTSASANGGFESVLKLPLPGRAPYESGNAEQYPFVSGINTHGYYWTSNIDGTGGGNVRFNNFSMPFVWGYSGRATGMTVRCIKD
jgi:uncharacterized protein (TIGR02145 family)